MQEEFLKRLGEQSSEDEEDTSGDQDPRFHRKPRSASVLEGEMVRVTCETDGTHPLGMLFPVADFFRRASIQTNN